MRGYPFVVVLKENSKENHPCAGNPKNRSHIHVARRGPNSSLSVTLVQHGTCSVLGRRRSNQTEAVPKENRKSCERAFCGPDSFSIGWEGKPKSFFLRQCQGLVVCVVLCQHHLTQKQNLASVYPKPSKQSQEPSFLFVFGRIPSDR